MTDKKTEALTLLDEILERMDRVGDFLVTNEPDAIHQLYLAGDKLNEIYNFIATGEVPATWVVELDLDDEDADLILMNEQDYIDDLLLNEEDYIDEPFED